MEAKDLLAGDKTAAARARGWTLKRLGDEAVEAGECGERRRLFSQGDPSPAAFIHLVRIQGAKPHYHRLATEYYFVVEGRGTMTLDGEEVAIEKGSCLEIRPGTLHAASGDLLVLVIGVPRIAEEDTFYLD